MWGVFTEQGLCEYAYKTYEEAYKRWEILTYLGRDCEIWHY